MGCEVLIREEFDAKIHEFEEVLQKIATDIASGALVEKLQPSELLEKTDNYVSRLRALAADGEELMLVLKPEKAFTIKSVSRNFTQTLTTFKDILLQNTSDPLANSRLAVEQLRKALTDGSDFLFLMREVRDHPSPLMEGIIAFKKASETKGQVISIRSSEDVQPLIKYVFSRIDELRAALIGLEKEVDQMKQIMREIQEESVKILSGKTTTESKASETTMEKKQLSLSNFKTEGDGQHGND